MQFREASRIVRRSCLSEPKGNIQQGQIVTWESTKVRFCFTPNDAYTTEGTLTKTNLITGKKSVVRK